MFTPSILQKILQALPFSADFWVAYSGGLDSHVLLHSLASLRTTHPNLRFQAIHINHGLSENAEKWSKHCQHVCEALSIECIIKNVPSEAYGTRNNLEATARNFRYELLADILPDQAYLLTAHHRDDQMETLLLRLFRGAGVKGLSAMSFQRSLGKGFLVRPLLNISRQSLNDYARREKLHWIEDESNFSLKFDRNYLRQTVMPLLKTRWPSLSTVLARTAYHCQETSILLDKIALEDLTKVRGSIAGTLSVSALKQLSFVRQTQILRYWLNMLSLNPPDSKKINALIKNLLYARTDAMPLMLWNGAEIHRYKDDLYAFFTLLPHDTNAIIPWNLKTPLNLPANIGQLTVKRLKETTEATSANTISLPQSIATTTVRFRQGGERFHAYNRSGSHPLKKLFQEWSVPTWLRDRVPLLYFDEELAVVVGYAVSKNYAVTSDRRHNTAVLEFNPGLYF